MSRFFSILNSYVCRIRHIIPKWYTLFEILNILATKLPLPPSKLKQLGFGSKLKQLGSGSKAPAAPTALPPPRRPPRCCSHQPRSAAAPSPRPRRCRAAAASATALPPCCPPLPRFCRRRQSRFFSIPNSYIYICRIRHYSKMEYFV
jgi:hypothetical protein